MRSTISATELARRLGDVLGRIRYRGDSFVVEKNGMPVAQLIPVAAGAPTSLRDAFDAWRAAPGDAEFADDLDRVNAADAAPNDPWA